MKNISEIVKIINHHRVLVRVIEKKSEVLMTWKQWITIPSDSYIDIGLAPIKIDSIQFIDINCTKIIEIGRLMPVKKINLLHEIEIQIQSLNIEYNIINDEILRLKIG